LGDEAGTAEIIWSMATTEPGAVAGGVMFLLTGALDLHALFLALPNRQAAHFGTLQFLREAGNSLRAANCRIFLKDT